MATDVDVDVDVDVGPDVDAFSFCIVHTIDGNVVRSTNNEIVSNDAHVKHSGKRFYA